MPATLETLVVCDLLNICALLFLLSLLGQNLLLPPTRLLAYRVTILLTAVVMAAEIAVNLLEQLGAPWRAAHLIANTVGFACSGALPYILAITYEGKLLRRRTLALPAALAVLCLLSMGTGWIFQVGPDCTYSRGPLFWVYVAVLLLGIALLLWANLRQSERLARQEKVYLNLLFLLFLLGISAQLLRPQIHASWLCVTLCLLLYYIFQRELQFKYDLLTEALNRASFERDLKGGAFPVNLVAVFDLDNFKHINDTCGHPAGDRCLQNAAAVLQHSFRGIGRCYRIGGDEFALLANARPERMEACVRRMLQEIEARRRQEPTFPNISYGFCFRTGDETLQDVFRRADQQMYHYKKEHGRSRSEFPEPS